MREGHVASTPPMKTEAIAQEMLKELLCSRLFQRYLIESTVEQVMRDATPTDSTIRGQRVVRQSVACGREAARRRRSVIEEDIDTLVRMLQLVTESFIRSSNFAFCDIGADTNRDAAALFSARLQLERLLNCGQLQLLQFEQIVRRLCTLLRCFATRISTPFQIANCAFFASSVCEFLYRFEEFCSIHERNFTQEFEHLRKAIDCFHRDVVCHLNKMITVRIEEECATKKAVERYPRLRQTPQKPKSATVFREVKRGWRSPGFLLPQDLCEKRRTMLSKSAAILCSPVKRTWKRARSTPQKRYQQNSAEENAAFRLAHEMTKEMVNNLATRVNAVVSRH